jgi:hypothetical protein
MADPVDPFQLQLVDLGRRSIRSLFTVSCRSVIVVPPKTPSTVSLSQIASTR